MRNLAYILLLLLTVNSYSLGNSYERSYVINSISNSIANRHYWTAHSRAVPKLFPEDESLDITINKINGDWYGVISSLIDGIKYNEIYRITILNDLIYNVENYFNDMIKKRKIIRAGSNCFYSTIIIPSKWEPTYNPVNGIKSKIVDDIKKLTVGFVNTLIARSEADKEKLKKSDVVLYLKDFYVWEKGTTCLIQTKIGSAFCNINIHMDGKYYVYIDIVPTKWKVPNDFKVEGYNGEMLYMRRFAKYYLKYTLKYEDKIYFNEWVD